MSVFAYSFRPSFFARERSYRLDADALTRTKPGPLRRVDYGDITQIDFHRYKVRGASGARRALNWRCTVYSRSGPKIELVPIHTLGFRAKEDRSVTYLPFLSELQTRVRASNPEVVIRSNERWSLATSRVMGPIRGYAATLLLKSLRPIPTDYLASAGGWLARKFGPLTSAHKIARSNIAAAYPDASPAWRNEVLADMWDNLGRFAVEYVHLDRLWDYEPGKPPGRIAHDPPSIQRMIDLHDSGKPVLIFTGHIANFELLGVASAAFGVNFAVVYRKLNAGPLVDELFKLRSRLWGAPILLEHSHDTSFQMLEALKGGTSLAMLLDQYHPGGVDVTFFGRRCKANPSLAKLARQFELPIHGARVVRLPGHRFRTEFTEPLEPVRDGDGKIDVQGTMQAITRQIESWVREHPEQWLWAHRRWR